MGVAVPTPAAAWLWPILFAPFIGSAMGVLIIRLPVGRPVGLARSRCAACDTVLGIPDLVPLLSYAVLRGRCRHCRQPIGWFHPAIEIAAVAVAAWAACAGAEPARIWASCALGWTLLTLAWIDGRTLLLPDVLTLPLLVGGLAFTWFEQSDAVADHALAAALAFLSLCALAYGYRRLRGFDGLGGGDAKLLAAAGAWCGPVALPIIILGSALLGLATALILSLRSGTFGTRTPIPFGPCLAAAIWLAWLYPDWVDRLAGMLGRV